jgi:hypothetical protein
MPQKIYAFYVKKVSCQRPVLTYNLVTRIRSSIRFSRPKLNRMHAGECNAFICYAYDNTYYHCDSERLESECTWVVYFVRIVTLIVIQRARG